MFLSHTLLALLAGSAAAAPAAQQRDTAPAGRSIEVSRSPAIESRDTKPAETDPFFAPCYASPDCEVIWSDRLDMWRTNVTNPGTALTRLQFDRERTSSNSSVPLSKRADAITKVRLGDTKTFFGDAWPADVMHAALFNICDNWGCINSWSHSVALSKVESSNNGGRGTNSVVRVHCEGSWRDNWDMRNALADLGSEAYQHEVQQEWQDSYCNSNNINGLNFWTCYEGINKYYHANKILTDNYAPDGTPMGGYSCTIEGVPENKGGGMCGFFWNLGVTLTGFIPTLGPYASALLGSVPGDGICY